MGQVEGYAELLQAALDRAQHLLGERIMEPLVEHLADLGFRQVTLIPRGKLSLLPLHAIAFEKITATYAPSASALQAAKNAAAKRVGLSPTLLAIGNPLPNPNPLPFARAEVEEIAPLFDSKVQRVLNERQATRAETLKKQTGTTHLHFACHGAFNVEEPLDSALFLSGDDTITLRDLLSGDLDLSASRLAVLSACQTGITDFQRVPDEAIGFPAGFLQAGVPGVISTLWPVADISTALLFAHFYRCHLQEGKDAAIALHQAQAWLRNSTAVMLNLADWYKRLYEASMKRDTKAFMAMRYYKANPYVKPFSHPYFWAAFIFSGI